ncbi:unnamed protein product [Phytophthora fragariaefolia]|uniref:Unnamed protein product n=1 Tax=Phytophthora fragariaefolia TaxID=1490495 RepID=A0A9W7CS87_9STRA|nr:unnamed protein product [Phytophthora fragariaefolia]
MPHKKSYSAVRLTATKLHPNIVPTRLGESSCIELRCAQALNQGFNEFHWPSDTEQRQLMRYFWIVSNPSLQLCTYMTDLLAAHVVFHLDAVLQPVEDYPSMVAPAVWSRSG